MHRFDCADCPHRGLRSVCFGAAFPLPGPIGNVSVASEGLPFTTWWPPLLIMSAPNKLRPSLHSTTASPSTSASSADRLQTAFAIAGNQ
jgi:hypothetical protein